MKQKVVNISTLSQILEVEATTASWGGGSMSSYQSPGFSSVSSQTSMLFPFSK